MSTPGRQGSATSSTAGPPCRWPRSESRNAGDPAGAYAEAVELAGAHQSSYGREAAAVFAAAVAAAMAPGASVDDGHHARLGLARDGTRDAIEAVVEAARPCPDWQSALGILREAVRPSTRSGKPTGSPTRTPGDRAGSGRSRSCRWHWDLLVITDGDVAGTILGATNYGRDSDSIATMGGAIAGALGGERLCRPTGRRPSRPPPGSTCGPAGCRWPA